MDSAAGKSRPHGCAELHALQLLPSPQDAARYSRDGGWVNGSRLEHRRTDSVIERKQMKSLLAFVIRYAGPVVNSALACTEFLVRELEVGTTMRLLYVTILLCSCALAGDSATADFVSTINRLKSSVVPIVCVGVNPDGNAFLISVEGTGFFLSDDGDIVTAGHVAQGLFKPGRIPACPIPAIYVPFLGWNEAATALNLHVSFINRCWWSDSDVGVCSLKENPFTVSEIAKKPIVATLDTVLQKEGTIIAFTGFPLTFLQPISSEGIIGAYQSVEPSIGPKVMLIDKNAWPGASGSPVYNISGNIVGIVVQRGFNDADGLAFARTSVFVQNFLAENKQSRKADDNQKKK